MQKAKKEKSLLAMKSASFNHIFLINVNHIFLGSWKSALVAFL
jgi:hypothetical protein